MEKNDWAVAIVAAGRGSRLGVYTDAVNKALLPVAGKAVISHIIEKFPSDREFIIAVGYEKETLKEYLYQAHPTHHFRFVDVDRLTGPGSGPGYSLLCCRPYLQRPFIFTTVDTLVKGTVPAPSYNWLGVAAVSDTRRFNSVKIKNGHVTNMRDKEVSDNTHAFIGLCGIADHELFWQALAADGSPIAGEIQVSNGLRALVKKGMQAEVLDWHDTGTIDEYQRACEAFSPPGSYFDFSKSDEFIYFVENRVIKYFRDPTVIKNRVRRATHLADVVPIIDKVSNHFYSYSKIPGQTLYQALNLSIAQNFLQWLSTTFWETKELDPHEGQQFITACRKFYQDKTYDRMKKYWTLTKEEDQPAIVNGVSVPPLDTLLQAVDWENIAHGIPSRFHGDLQFDNVLVTDDAAHPFVLLDWRSDFGGLLDYGDLYYDLAKLQGGMIIPYNQIKKNIFFYHQEGVRIDIEVPTGDILDRTRELFRTMCQQQGYDLDRIDLITALIFLNMSPLHHQPFRSLLFHLGRKLLADHIRERVGGK